MELSWIFFRNAICQKCQDAKIMGTKRAEYMRLLIWGGVVSAESIETEGKNILTAKRSRIGSSGRWNCHQQLEL